MGNYKYKATDIANVLNNTFSSDKYYEPFNCYEVGKIINMLGLYDDRYRVEMFDHRYNNYIYRYNNNAIERVIDYVYENLKFMWRK